MTLASRPLGMSELQWDPAGPAQAGPRQEVTRVSCQELGKYLLLGNIPPVLNSSSLAPVLGATATQRSAHARADWTLPRGHLGKQGSEHVAPDQDTRRPNMHSSTRGESGAEGKGLADKTGGRGG